MILVDDKGEKRMGGGRDRGSHLSGRQKEGRSTPETFGEEENGAVKARGKKSGDGRKEKRTDYILSPAAGEKEKRRLDLSPRVRKGRKGTATLCGEPWTKEETKGGPGQERGKPAISGALSTRKRAREVKKRKKRE